MVEDRRNKRFNCSNPNRYKSPRSSLYSTTPNNIVYLENEYYASVWNTNAGNLGETLISAPADVDLSLNVAASVTNIEIDFPTTTFIRN